MIRCERCGHITEDSRHPGRPGLHFCAGPPDDDLSMQPRGRTGPDKTLDETAPELIHALQYFA